ncbi:hypothetical protein BO70DRAFT_365390 [Aspergillus heteromorphus CBS 117.55]|uniref:Uncharacterized protein n=1 Tax=Aspergillus heteromorphus CBS 117.55 TaxID=1448321 RepID=A0A317VAP4_9EURO|nr:uncharacterized protein BO70DRAFT_365390 [Aspergillus heteromorphus CBS 117.55]PWY70449.1 hypothetical protein BO70DRAFT_365390 [Aspergillus heteromorphus CBS 117.55]
MPLLLQLHACSICCVDCSTIERFLSASKSVLKANTRGLPASLVAVSSCASAFVAFTHLTGINHYDLCLTSLWLWSAELPTSYMLATNS